MTAGHLVVGAGPVGTAVANLLASRDTPVRLVSRRGLGPDHPLVERVQADAADTDRLCTLAAGSAVIYNCINPSYHRWPQDWPPMAEALLAAAESAGAVLATVSSTRSRASAGTTGARPSVGRIS
jgi:2-polyprenyl-6-methoxyphenol hydroxylase-like FAD-dependent oxidoreductase